MTIGGIAGMAVTTPAGALVDVRAHKRDDRCSYRDHRNGASIAMLLRTGLCDRRRRADCDRHRRRGDRPGDRRHHVGAGAAAAASPTSSGATRPSTTAEMSRRRRWPVGLVIVAGLGAVFVDSRADGVAVGRRDALHRCAGNRSQGRTRRGAARTSDVAVAKFRRPVSIEGADGAWRDADHCFISAMRRCCRCSGRPESRTTAVIPAR